MLSEELKAERIRLGVTRREMATALGVDVQTYAHWEYKRNPPAIVDAALEGARLRIAKAREKLKPPPPPKPKKPPKPKAKKPVWAAERSETAFQLLNRFTNRNQEEPVDPKVIAAENAAAAAAAASNRPAISPIVRLKVEERIIVALGCYAGNAQKVHKLLARKIAAAEIDDIAKQAIRPLISLKAIEKIKLIANREAQG